jgi:hypothetical protein
MTIKFRLLCRKLVPPTIVTSSISFFPYQKDDWAMSGYLVTRRYFSSPHIKRLSLQLRRFNTGHHCLQTLHHIFMSQQLTVSDKIQLSTQHEFPMLCPTAKETAVCYCPTYTDRWYCSSGFPTQYSILLLHWLISVISKSCKSHMKAASPVLRQGYPPCPAGVHWRHTWITSRIVSGAPNTESALEKTSPGKFKAYILPCLPAISQTETVIRIYLL